MQGKRNKKHFGWLMFVIIVVIIGSFLLVQAFRTIYTHVKLGSYNNRAWEIVWPVIVSTLVAVFGTLVTSYVFLKDALDRTIDEKPYYSKIIGSYRKEKIQSLIIYSVIFIGVSCYLILFQSAAGEDCGEIYDLPLYFGIVAVAALLCCSLYFLYECINIDKSIFKSAKKQLKELNADTRGVWEKLKDRWERFIESYVLEKQEFLQKFLEVEENSNCMNMTFDKEKFIVKFSEWEKFILLMIDKSSGFQAGQSVEQRIIIASGYIQKLDVIQSVERKDAIEKGWNSYAYGYIKQYGEIIDNGKIEMDDFLTFYQLLSDYRDTLQVVMDKKFSTISGKRKTKKDAKKVVKEDDRYILYIFFLLKFYSYVKCLVTLPRIELFYPSAKMYNVDFYNVRFENTSFRASLFCEVMFARMKMVGSNMAFSKFVNCNFYNADIRDCSVSNSYFGKCLMADMVLFNVDATGTVFTETDLTGTTFENTVVVNVEFHNSRFEYTGFVNCKVVQVKFENVVDGKFVHANFEKSIMRQVNFVDAGVKMSIPDKYKACNRNYFRDLHVHICSNGIKKRQDSDIWNQLNIRKYYGIDLTGASFLETIAEDIRFQDACLNASIFTGSDMQRSRWKNVRMKGCVLKEANLTGAEVEYTDLDSCVMTESILYKAKFCLANLQNSNLSGCHASESVWKCCVLDKSDVSRIDLTKSQVEYSSFRDTIMTEAELTYAKFKDVLFDNSNGKGILSSYCRFDECSFVNAFLALSNFNYTIFIQCDMKLASMTGSTIEEADFIACDLENSNFKECTFIKVHFRDNRNISKDIFSGCTFIECKFEGDNEQWGRKFREDSERYTFI